ncbi:hypothetical protein [uncultured Duncaniella sp.]|uniref:hypothetical protein n=1 Tax=uncultured Duncaniella sp. TaxID=2768039 RepID=UPI0015AD6969|nr:hypothetical protein [uncultured Duncaniella sp.]
MEINNNNLQAATESIVANVQKINNLRTQLKGTDQYEAAQMLLIGKFGLSQTEASEIIDDLKSGIKSYQETHTSMMQNTEETVKASIASAVAGMNEAERVRYLASMLSALELASTTQELDQETIDNKLNANMAKSEEELANAIVVTIDNVPVDTLAKAAEQLDAETICDVASAIEKNTEEFRFSAALQLYIAQREGTFKVVEGSENLSPQLIGALSSGAVDAMLATADLKAGKIDLTKWQTIMKYILGAVFAVAMTCLAILGMILITLPIMGLFWNVFGTGFFATLLLFMVLIPILRYGADKSTDAIMWMLDKLAPIYDTVVVKATVFFKGIYEKISNWIKARYGKVSNQVSENATQNNQSIQGRQEEQGYGNDVPAMA